MTAKHLIISLGEKTFLALPKRGMLVEGHCLIMPLESVVSSRECDEDVYIEFTRFKKQLQAMFFATNKSEVHAVYSLRFHRVVFHMDDQTGVCWRWWIGAVHRARGAERPAAEASHSNRMHPDPARGGGAIGRVFQEGAAGG